MLRAACILTLTAIGGNAANLLHHQQRMHFGWGEPPPPACNNPVPFFDRWKPIEQVVTEHPKTDGFCYFATILGDWSNRCAHARRQRDYLLYTMYFDYVYTEGTQNDTKLLPNNPLTVVYEHGTRHLRTHWRLFPLDDVYCDVVNGWWTRPPREQINSFTSMNEMSARECNRLINLYPESQSMSIREFMFDSLTKEVSVRAAANGIGGGPSIKDMELHALSKCLIGGMDGLACDIANCATNFCKLANGNYGHGQNECGSGDEDDD